MAVGCSGARLTVAPVRDTAVTTYYPKGDAVNERAIENFDDFMTDALEPDDYPGDDALEWYDPNGNLLPVVTDEQAAELRAADVDPTPARERWKIRDDRAASYGFRRLRRAEQEIADVERLALEQIEQIRRYVEKATSKARSDASFFQGALVEWYETVVYPSLEKHDPLTRHVPGGSVGSTTGSTVLEIVDEEAALEWLKGRGLTDCVKVEESVRVSAVKSRFTPADPAATPVGPQAVFVKPDDPAVTARRKVKPIPGEQVPGVQLVRKPRTVKVQPDVGTDR